MRHKTLLLLAVVALAMTTSSCVVTHNIHYRPVVKEGAGQRIDSTFAVDYGNFSLKYDVSGRVQLKNKCDSVIYIDMSRSCMIDTEGVQHPFYTQAFPSLTNLKSTAILYGSADEASVVPTEVPCRYLGISPFTTVTLPYPRLPRPLDEQLQDEEGRYPLVMRCGSHVMYYTTDDFAPVWRKMRVDLETDYDSAFRTNKEFAEAEHYTTESTHTGNDIVIRTCLSLTGKGVRVGVLSSVIVVGVVIPAILLFTKTPFAITERSIFFHP